MKTKQTKVDGPAHIENKRLAVAALTEAETALASALERDEDVTGTAAKYTAKLLAAMQEGALGSENEAVIAVQRFKQAEMPFWSEEVRAEANALIRSALFAATPNNSAREKVENEKIAALDGVEITFSGERLNQFDAQVFESILHLAREQSFRAEECQFSVSGYSILRTLGVENTVSSSRAVEDSLRRLRKAEFVIKWVGTRAKRVGGLIGFYDKTSEGHFRVGLVREITRMFEDDTTFMPRKLLEAVRRSPLASWLVRFYLSHEDPFSLTYEKLRELSGATEKTPRNVRARTKLALSSIAEKHAQLALEDSDYAAKTGSEAWLVVDEGKTVAVAHHRSSKKHRAAVATKATEQAVKLAAKKALQK